MQPEPQPASPRISSNGFPTKLTRLLTRGVSQQGAFLLISHAFDQAEDGAGHRLATTPITRFRQFHWWREAQSLLLIIPNQTLS